MPIPVWVLLGFAVWTLLIQIDHSARRIFRLLSFALRRLRSSSARSGVTSLLDAPKPVTFARSTRSIGLPSSDGLR